MDLADAKIRIFYFLREGYYNSMLSACKDALSNFKGDLSFQFLQALSFLLNNHYEECLHVLDSLRHENDYKLCCIICIMYANKLSGVSNKELYVKLDSQMREFRKNAESIDFYYSSLVLYALQKYEKSLEYIEKAVSLNQNTNDFSLLKGRILMDLNKKSKQINFMDLFESLDKTNLDVMLVLCEANLIRKNYKEALANANKAIVRFPNTELPLIYKLKILLAQQDWEQINEVLNRIMLINNDSLEALKVSLIVIILHDANFDEAILCIKKYTQVINKIESKNFRLIVKSARLLSYICGKNTAVLTETITMVEKAVQSEPNNVDFLIEMGNQYLLQNKKKDALKCFKNATKIKQSSLEAIVGLTYTEYTQNGLSNQVKQQISYLFELEESDSNPRALFLKSKLSENKEEKIHFLTKASAIHLEKLKNLPYSDTYLLHLNPNFLLELVKEILKNVPITPDYSFKSISKIKSNSILIIENILLTIVKSCPSLYESFYLLAKIEFFFLGDASSALTHLEMLFRKENIPSEAFILMAQVQIFNNLHDRALQTLENCLSHDFQIRDSPMYHYINGIVQKKLGNLQDAVKSFTNSLSLLNQNLSERDENISEKSAVYIELIESLNELGQIDESMKYLDEATERFQKTSEASRILILCADQAVGQRSIQKALDLLTKVGPSDVYYSQARTKYADILLNYRKDKKAYLKCYLDIVEEEPLTENYNMLGDAYMAVLDPDNALQAYKTALDINPKDLSINLKMGRMLQFAHYFRKAEEFYKEAIQNINSPKLKTELAKLYINMGEYSKAENLLKAELESEEQKNVDDITYLQFRTNLLNLLAEVQEKSGNDLSAINSLKNAKENQNRLRKRLIMEYSNAPKTEIDSYIAICSKLAELCVSQKDNSAAVSYYKEALEVSPQNILLLNALAKLYMQMNLLDMCQKTCSSILQIEPENESASVIMADIAFCKIDFEMALFHSTQLLAKEPTNWIALEKLIEMMRRTGTLDDAQEYLTKAENQCENAQKISGFLYCTALHQWYAGNLNGALRNFNLARQDFEYGEKSIYNMIEICLNSEDDMFTEQFIDTDDIEYRDSRSMALKTADRLLKELKQKLEANKEDMFRYKLLCNFRLLASKEKYNIEQALDAFVYLSTQNDHKDNVGPILGIATANTLLKQSQRAKNQLKRVIKMTWTFEDAEYLEKCWLLLADQYIQSTKFDVAVDLLNRVIRHNKSCSKAYEYVGFIAEKEQRYKDAVANYELAWKHGGKTNAGIGYRLAYNLLKIKKFADAIDVGHQVLKLNPDHPRLKKDILDKAMMNLRL